MYTAIQRQQMLDIAQRSIQHGLHLGARLRVNYKGIEAGLLKQQACFVTLKIGQEICGRMGSLEPNMTLIESIAHNAYSAAFNDPRFPPITKEEVDHLAIDITILNELEMLTCENEDELLAQLTPNNDGIVISEDDFTATFLPDVWLQFSEPKDFILHLKIQAGLPEDYWSDTLTFERFQIKEINSAPLS
jgi:AmmeMemoRadiSam system protein A